MDKRFSDSDIEKLAHKYKKGTLSAEELADFEHWYASHDDRIFAHHDAAHPKRVKARMLKKLLEGIGASPLPQQKTITRNLWFKLSAAAAIILASVVIYFYSRARIDPDILPGYSQAILTLADGHTISLDSAQSGIIIQEEHITYDDGSVIEAKGVVSAPDLNTQYLILATPRGGQYQIILSDGTKVWLNAASTLKYPSRFSGESREVELEGEAYFSVNNKNVMLSEGGGKAMRGVETSPNQGHGLKPFIVKTRNQATTVLGTEFNIDSYESTVKTTLATGAIQVANYIGRPAGASRSEAEIPTRRGRPRTFGLSDSKILSPGQQSINSEAGIQVRNVNINSELAWKNGKFQFMGETLSGAMQQLARWYDIEVIFADEGLRQAPVSAIISRQKSLSAVLEIFEKAGLHFQLDGRQLTIKKK